MAEQESSEKSRRVRMWNRACSRGVITVSGLSKRACRVLHARYTAEASTLTITCIPITFSN